MSALFQFFLFLFFLQVTGHTLRLRYRFIFKILGINVKLIILFPKDIRLTL